MGKRKKLFIYDKITADFIAQLYDKYRIKMLKLAFSILNDWHEAEDAVEESFINIARNSGKIIDSEDYKISAYLVNTVRNTSLKILINKIKTDFEDMEDIEKYASAGDSAEEIAVSGISYDELKDMVEELSPKYKLVLNMKYMGYNNKEIAEELNVKAGTVRVMLLRIRSALKKSKEGRLNGQGQK